MKEMIVCQSCSMPLGNESDKGTNADGTVSTDYCKYCFEKGEFISYQTLEEAISDSVNYAEYSGKTKEEALADAKTILPTLKRWKCTCTDECASGYNPNCICKSSECHCTKVNN